MIPIILILLMVIEYGVQSEDNDMTENGKETMLILADLIKGDINRICVTNNLSEFICVYDHAKKGLDKLLRIIYDERFKVESED